MPGSALRIAIALGTCLAASGCEGGERYVVSQADNQLMVVDQIDRNAAEPTARITIISSRPEASGISAGQIRRLSFDAHFKCREGMLRYGAAVAVLEAGGTFSAPEAGVVWEHPEPGTPKANAIKAVCSPGASDAMRATGTLDAIERRYRQEN